jgi:hypothetical protein
MAENSGKIAEHYRGCGPRSLRIHEKKQIEKRKKLVAKNRKTSAAKSLD